MKVEECSQCEMGFSDYKKWNAYLSGGLSKKETLEYEAADIYCNSCSGRWLLFDKAPESLYDYFHFIHAAMETKFGEIIEGYGVRAGFGVYVPSGHCESVIPQALPWPMSDDGWHMLIKVFFGETEKENHNLYVENNGEYYYWPMECEKAATNFSPQFLFDLSKDFGIPVHQQNP